MTTLEKYLKRLEYNLIALGGDTSLADEYSDHLEEEFMNFQKSNNIDKETTDNLEEMFVKKLDPPEQMAASLIGINVSKQKTRMNTITYRISGLWKWYRHKILSTTRGLSLSLLIIWAIPGLLNGFFTILFVYMPEALKEPTELLVFPFLFIIGVPLVVILPTGYMLENIQTQFIHSEVLMLLFILTIIALNLKVSEKKILTPIIAVVCGYWINLFSLRMYAYLIGVNDPEINEYVIEIIQGSIYIVGVLCLIGVAITLLFILLKKMKMYLVKPKYQLEKN